MVPGTDTSLHPLGRHLDRFSRFAGLVVVTDTQTDNGTIEQHFEAISRICARDACDAAEHESRTLAIPQQAEAEQEQQRHEPRNQPLTLRDTASLKQAVLSLVPRL